jgi:autotransporter-associated beta strand protein
VTNNGMLVVNCSDACTVAGPINGSGGVVAAGSGTLVLAGADTYSGGTTLLAGTLAIKNASSLGAGPVMLSGGELDNTSAAPVTLSTTKPETWNGDFGFVGTQNLSLGTAAVTLSGSGDRQVTVARGTLTTNGPIGGSNGLVKAGPGALALGGKNTYSGGTTVNGGTLAVRAGARLGAAGGPLVVNNLNTGPGTAVVVNLDSAQTVGGLGGTLATPASGTNTAAVNLNGKSVILTVNPGTGGTYAGALTGSGGLVKAGFGLLALAGVGTYTGGTTLSAGTLGIDSALALGTGKLVIDGGALDNTTATGVTVSTNNAQTWKADFSFVGTQDLNLGTGAVALSGNRDVTIQAGTLGIGGVISGRYGLTKAGSGTLALDGANTYTGGTTLTAGRLVVAGSMGGAAIRAQGGVLENDGTIVGATMVGPGALAQGTGRYGPVTIQSGGTFSPGNGIGQVTSGPTAWYGGGGYHLDLGDATGTAGSGWDLWNIVGGLSLAATAGGLCTIDLEGPASHFDNTSPDSWLIATATGGISGFNSADFVVDQLSSLPLAGGHFAMSESGNALYLDFVPDPAAPAPGLSSATGRVAMPAGFGSLNAVPEPSTLLLLTAGFIGLTGFAWRQRKRTAPGIVPMP